MAIEKTIRVVSSFEEMHRLDREDVLRTSAAQRVVAAIEMITGAYDDAPAPRLARILRVARCPRGPVRHDRRGRGTR